MAREIEIKIPLTQEQFLKIQENILNNSHDSLKFSGVERLFKSDEYYSRYTSWEERKKSLEPKVIRIRSEKSENLQEKAWFTIKNKKIENGIEINEEQETLVENPQVLRNLFSSTGFNKWFSKTKEAVSCVCTNISGGLEFHLELEKVNGLLYIEIEYTEDEPDYETVRTQLEETVTSLQLDLQKKDSRSWVQILGEKS